MTRTGPRDVPTRPVRICAAVGLFGLGCALWWLGARDAPPLGVPAKLAWVPFVAMAWLNLRWRSALRR